MFFLVSLSNSNAIVESENGCTDNPPLFGWRIVTSSGSCTLRGKRHPKMVSAKNLWMSFWIQRLHEVKINNKWSPSRQALLEKSRISLT